MLSSQRLSIACFLSSLTLGLGVTASQAAELQTQAPAAPIYVQTFPQGAAPAQDAGNGAVSDPAPVTSPAPAQPMTVRERASSLVSNALSFIGVKYRRGGNEPDTGFDCSGLVRYVFHDAWGLDLPRRAVEISHIGERIGKDQLQPGDLVFYSTLKKTVSHVGIYLGDGQFIHAPRRGEEVRIEDMNQPYWAKRFSGARRVSQDEQAQLQIQQPQ